jgi:hypothetical protein
VTRAGAASRYAPGARYCTRSALRKGIDRFVDGQEDCRFQRANRERCPQSAHVAPLLGGRGDYLASPAPPLNDADAVALLQPRNGIESKRAEKRRGG